ncbi:MAG: hypothetical protein U5P10_07685 [Spirochaetia bacterium]|nr:hypothetical protein [Spirochaetia bacterium]
MNIGDTIHVEDLDIPEGVKVLSLPEQVLVTVTTQKEELPEEEEEVEGEEGLEGEEAEGEEAEGEGEEGAEE